MTDRRFFGTNKLVNDYTTNLDKVETLDGGWTIRYIDKLNNQEWLKYTVDPDRGYYFNLMLTTPRMTTNDIMDVAFGSKHLDEISAAAYRLNLEEKDEQKEYREKLLKRLTGIQIENLDKFEKERLRTIIIAGQLTDKVNSRIKVGQTIERVKEDFDFFDNISRKAKEFLDLIN
jgi:hypothetical protein